MMRAFLGAAALLLLATGAPAAKTILYPIEPDIMAKTSNEIGLAISPMPARGPRNIVLTVAPAADHEVVRGGQMGGGNRLDNPVSGLMRDVLAARDVDGRLGNEAAGVPTLSIKVDRAATLSRCVNVAELKGLCMVRSTMVGSAALGGGAAQPIRIELERSFKGVMISHGIALVTREAALQFLAQAETMSN